MQRQQTDLNKSETEKANNQAPTYSSVTDSQPKLMDQTETHGAFENRISHSLIHDLDSMEVDQTGLHHTNESAND
jgi:hypothetical protein